MVKFCDNGHQFVLQAVVIAQWTVFMLWGDTYARIMSP